MMLHKINMGLASNGPLEMLQRTWRSTVSLMTKRGVSQQVSRQTKKSSRIGIRLLGGTICIVGAASLELCLGRSADIWQRQPLTSDDKKELCISVVWGTGTLLVFGGLAVVALRT